jgi:hypothetical protein
VTLVNVDSIGNGTYQLNLPIEMLIIVGARLLNEWCSTPRKRPQRRPDLTSKRRPARRPAHLSALISPVPSPGSIEANVEIGADLAQAGAVNLRAASARSDGEDGRESKCDFGPNGIFL